MMKKLTLSNWLMGLAAFALLLPSMAQAYPFSLTADYPISNSPAGMATADLNGDGKLDLAIANNGADAVSVMLSNGYGTFGGAVDYAVGVRPYFVAAGDFDNDGNQDLVVTNGNEGTLGYLHGVGDGTFSGYATTIVGASPRGMTVADFDRDGNLDVAVANMSDGTFSILLGNGDGTFAPKADFASGLYPVDIAAADLDRDGNLDVAVANSCAGCFVPYNGGSARVHLGDGAGNFGAAAVYATTKGPVSLRVADLNGDSWPDIVVGKRTANQVGVFINDRTGLFSPIANYAAGSLVGGLLLADLNADGKTDVLAACGGSNDLSYLAGIGDGTFDLTRVISAGNSPQWAVSGDFNHDGRTDFAVGNAADSDIRVYLDSNAPVVTSLNPSSGSAGSGATLVTVNGSGFSPNSKVSIGGSDYATTFISSSQVRFTLSAGDLGREGTLSVTLTNPSTGLVSSSTNFTVTAGVTASGGGSLPPEAFLPPVAPNGGFKVIINEGAKTTSQRMVSLKFIKSASHEPRATRFAVSNEPDFKTASIEEFSRIDSDAYAWDLCAQAGGAILPADCPTGNHTVYVKFYSSWGNVSPVVSSDIEYGMALATPDAKPQTPAAVDLSLGGFRFDRNLRAGSQGADVRLLQQFLNRYGFTVAPNGAGSSGNETNYFGPATRSALIRFQEAHAAQILQPSGLTFGTGYFGPATRGFINGM
jgi:hypothetical protein